MLFIVSKLIDALLLPSNVIGLAAFLGLVLLALRRRKAGAAILALAAFLLVIVGWSPLGSAALRALETRFPQPAADGDVTGIVVLGGEIDTHVSAERNIVALTDAGERLTKAAELALRYPHARILLSGGLADLLLAPGKTEAALGRDLLVQIGVPEGRIELEERSRTTCENAVESKAVARPQPGDRWLLVTSAYHMPRAVACFRKARFPIVPYPVDYRTRGFDLRRPSSSIAAGLAASDLAAHEWIGLAAYSLIEGTDFFPSPETADRGR